MILLILISYYMIQRGETVKKREGGMDQSLLFPSGGER